MTKEVIAPLFIEKSLISLYQIFPYSSPPNVLIYRACDLLGTRPVSQVIYWGKKCKQGFMVSAAEFIPLTSQLEFAPMNSQCLIITKSLRMEYKKSGTLIVRKLKWADCEKDFQPYSHKVSAGTRALWMPEMMSHATTQISYIFLHRFFIYSAER